jgi:predicted PurR-regulated permease PerM
MTSRQVLSTALIVVATLIGLYLIYVLRSTVLLLLGAVIVASAIRPYVAWLEKRRFPPIVSILLIYAVVFGGLTALMIWVVPPLVMFAVDLFASGALTDRITSMLTALAWAGWDRFRVVIPVFEVPQYLSNMVAETTEEVQRAAWPIAQSTLVGLSQFLLMLFIIFYWLTAREKMLSVLLLLSPGKHRPTVNAIWTDVENRLGAYVRGMAFLMLIIGGIAYVGLLLLRIPYALPLAVIAGVMEAVPMIGAFLGAVPAVLVALTVSPTAAILTALFFIALQSVEGNVIVPRVMSSQVGLNPLVIVIAMVAGATLNGIIGMLLAIPIAAALQVIFQHVWVKPAIESLPLAAVQAENGSEEDAGSASDVVPELGAVPVADENGDGIAERVVRPASSVEAADDHAAREAAHAAGEPLPDISEEEVIEPEAVGLPTPEEILAVHAPALDEAAEAARAEAEEEAAATAADELPTPEAILAATAVLEEEEAAKTDEQAAVAPAGENGLPESAPDAVANDAAKRENATPPASGREGKA